MFNERYDELRIQAAKLTASKESLYEVAKQFRILGETKNPDDPVESSYVALAKYGEMCCYKRLNQQSKVASLSISIARLYLKTAEYYYQVSKNIHDSWGDYLSNSFQSYKTAIDIYKNENQGSIASLLLIELGENEMKFEQFHYAGQSFEESVDIAITQKMPTIYVFGPMFKAVDAYCKGDRFDLAMELLDKVENKYRKNIDDEMKDSKNVKEQYNDMMILRTILLLLKSDYSECIAFANDKLDENVAKLFGLLCETSQKYQVSKYDAFLFNAKSQRYFNDLEISLLEMKLSIVSRCLEISLSMTK